MFGDPMGCRRNYRLFFYSVVLLFTLFKLIYLNTYFVFLFCSVNHKIGIFMLLHLTSIIVRFFFFFRLILFARWVIQRAGTNRHGCTATVAWRCVWHKFTVIKGLIEGKCRSDVRSFNIAFLEVHTRTRTRELGWNRGATTKNEERDT